MLSQLLQRHRCGWTRTCHQTNPHGHETTTSLVKQYHKHKTHIKTQPGSGRNSWNNFDDDWTMGSARNPKPRLCSTLTPYTSRGYTLSIRGHFCYQEDGTWSAVVPRCVRLCTLPPPSLGSRPPSRLRHLPPALVAAREVCGADLVSLLTPATVIPTDVNSTRSCSTNTRKDGRNKRVRHGQNGGL